jgi:hypothetical protein
LLWSSIGFTVLKNQISAHISAISTNLKKKIFTCRIKTEEHATGMTRHARLDTARGLKKSSREIPAIPAWES